MFDRGTLREGMTVHSADGEKLGKIQSCGERTFVIEKGFFLPTDYVCRYEDVTAVDGDDVRLAVTKDAFEREERGEELRAEGEGELRVPISEEELEAVKREREAGEVRLRKDVVTEHRTVDVPVTKERVRVEHTPASGRTEAGAGAFEEQSVSVPIKEEEVELRKRPVVKEEVRLKKERAVEHRAIGTDVRREELGVEGDAEDVQERELRDRDRIRRDPGDLE